MEGFVKILMIMNVNAFLPFLELCAKCLFEFKSELINYVKN